MAYVAIAFFGRWKSLEAFLHEKIQVKICGKIIHAFFSAFFTSLLWLIHLQSTHYLKNLDGFPVSFLGTVFQG
jgi:hypothetical protein